MRGHVHVAHCNTFPHHHTAVQSDVQWGLLRLSGRSANVPGPGRHSCESGWPLQQPDGSPWALPTAGENRGRPNPALQFAGCKMIVGDRGAAYLVGLPEDF